MNLTVFVGSRHEGYGEAGMAHLLEHMVFKGTPSHPNIPQALQGRGAQFNGTTSPVCAPAPLIALVAALGDLSILQMYERVRLNLKLTSCHFYAMLC